MKKLVIAVIVLAGLAATFFALAPGYLERQTNKVADHAPYAISEGTAATHASLIVADLHSDTLLWARDPLDRASRGHVDVPRLIEGNVTLQIFSVVTKAPQNLNYDENTADSDQITLAAIVQAWPPRTWDSLYERALYQAIRLHDAEAQAPGRLKIIKTRTDLATVLSARANATSLVGGLLATEGSHALEGDLANVQNLYDAGFRMMGLQHFFDNELGGSLHGVSNAGLTPFGKDAVREMERLNVIVDVAHSSAAVVEDVLTIATRPFIVSHTGVKGACDSARNLEDALMQRIAAKGGLIGIGYWDGAVCDPSPAGVVKSMRYAIDLVGVDHVGLGSDYDGATTVTFDTSEIAVLTEEMRKANFTPEEIKKVMGANVARLLADLLPEG